jgi:hypothetical protein
MERRYQVHNLIILDESGSMESIKPNIIQGFNELIQTMQGIEKQFPEQQHFISLLSFNGLGFRTQLDCQPLAALTYIDHERYQPAASTPLYDAIGLAIAQLQAHLRSGEEHKVLVTILTDGEENASQEYTGKSIKALIESLKERGNWTFTYIGTDHNVSQSAISISITNVLRFEKNGANMKDMFLKEGKARYAYSQKISEGKAEGEGFYEEE